MQEQVTGERPLAGDTADYGLFRGQPHGLITVAGFEMWERFSFYGIQVILAYYIYYSVTDGGLGWSTATAVAIVGAYGGAVYIVQPIGTWLADRVLGVRYMVLAGGIIIMSGHITLGLVPGAPGLFIGLALIVVGTGAMMANVTAMVGTLYRHGETGRRDAGYSLFYMGIMAGAFLGPIFTGLQTVYGFHVAFLAAAVGMACGIVWYIAGWKRGRLPDSSRSVPNPLSSQGRIRMALGSLVFVVSIGALCAFGVINVENINNIIFGALIVASIGILAFIYRSGNIEVSPV